MSDYLDTLKSLNVRPKKVKVEQSEILLEVSTSDLVLEQFIAEQPNDGMNDMHVEIIKWVQSNPKASHEDAIAFAQELGIDIKELDHHIFMILADILTEGKSKGKDIDPDPEQLKMGIGVEMEHTTEPLISRKIAMDHLAEIPDYYTRLDKMEREAGVEHHDE